VKFLNISNVVELVAAVLDIIAFIVLLLRLAHLLPREKKDQPTSDGIVLPALGCGGCFFGFVLTVFGAFVGIGGLIYHFRAEIKRLWELLTAGA